MLEIRCCQLNAFGARASLLVNVRMDKTMDPYYAGDSLSHMRKREMRTWD